MVMRRPLYTAGMIAEKHFHHESTLRASAKHAHRVPPGFSQ
jgi:hypothetical protein